MAGGNPKHFNLQDDPFELFLLGEGEKKIEEKVFSVAHPNVPELFIRVQTDGTITPRDVFTSVCEKLIKQLEMLHQEFTREWELRRITNTGEQGNMQNGH
ncbi:DNA-directed RNA polymerase II core subunit [Fusarium oxysporum]|nr:DNA-directed RNA polymerase II core subunit [Fusarium oxysporum]